MGTVRPDWNTDLSFDIASKEFKSEETEWRYGTAIADLENVRQIIFLVYCGTHPALIYFDSIAAE